jgi:hypothetical protein
VFFCLSYFNLLLLAKGIDEGIAFELTPGTELATLLCKKCGTKTSELK